MITYNKSKVYREDWSFSMEETMDYINDDGYIIQNDDVNGDETYDYIELSVYEQCEAADYALYTIENDLHDLLEARVDVEYQVVEAMVEHIKEYWYNGDFTDSIELIEAIEDGEYDEEMVNYDAYLKAESMLYELRNYNTSSMVMTEDLQDIAKVVDIRDEMIEMLEKVQEKLKGAEFYLDFYSSNTKNSYQYWARQGYRSNSIPSLYKGQG